MAHTPKPVEKIGQKQLHRKVDGQFLMGQPARGRIIDGSKSWAEVLSEESTCQLVDLKTGQMTTIPRSTSLDPFNLTWPS